MLIHQVIGFSYFTQPKVMSTNVQNPKKFYRIWHKHQSAHLRRWNQQIFGICLTNLLLLLPPHTSISLSLPLWSALPGASLCVGREQGRGEKMEEGKWEWASAGASCMLAFPLIMELADETDTLTWHMRESFVHDQDSFHLNYLHVAVHRENN